MSIPPTLGMSLNFTPLWLIDRTAQWLFSGVLKSHPDLFERLGEYANRRYRFSPTDLPLEFTVVPASRSLQVSRGKSGAGADAVISGPLFLLLALLEGRFDADALFFSRSLNVTGDMEAMLALRNALDDSAIDLPEELGALVGPLSPLAKGTASYIRKRVLEGGPDSWN